MKIRLLKICIGDWKNASRDMRELSVYQELGADILVLAKGNTKDRGRLDKVSTFNVHRFTTRPLGAFLPVPIQRLVAVFQWARYARTLSVNVISGHDLSGLLLGWMSNWFLPKDRRAKLIYDSHEFELGRNVKRNRFQKWLVKKVERFLIKRSAFTIVVNDIIADEVVRIHDLDRRPVVVRNIPKSFDFIPSECATIRKRFTEELQRLNSDQGNSELGSEDRFLLMYHGAITSERGIEMIIDVLAGNAEVCLILLGDGDDDYINELRNRARKMGASNRLLITSAVPQHEVLKYVGAVDVGLVLVTAKYRSYYFSLPNKFFENIHALTPVICSNFPAMKEIVDKYGIGLTCDPTDLQAINDCVERFRTDRHFLLNCKKNMSIAKQDLNWENEKGVLARAYLDVVSSFEC